tara:strand:- start:1214 stop:2068 length:855 start_codon:yes stop_codon:yes gene_type:complete
MKRILLPTDFSENAFNAMCYAFELNKHDKCEFFILHTFTPTMISAGNMMDSYSALTLQKIAQEKAEKQLNTLETQIKRDFSNPNHSYKTIASFNLLISEMERIVAENDIDMVIMGTKGATGAKEVFVGTHTMYAIKHLKVPVVAVPSEFDFEEPKEILFPTDYKLSQSNKYLSLIRDICSNHTSRLHILNAYYGTPLNEDQEATKSFFDDFFKSTAHLFHIVEDTDVIGAVERFQRRAKVNLIVMIHNKHSFFENLLFKPVINQIVFHTNVPFLVIPSEEMQNS